MDVGGSRKQWVFVVRVWLEPAASGPPALRGSVRDVHSGTATFFTSLKDLADFVALRGRLAEEPPEP
ncbi:MAG: hypothetical protein P8Y05_12040 [Deinococcales bacterium]